MMMKSVLMMMMFVAVVSARGKREETIAAYADHKENVVTVELSGSTLGLKHSSTIRHDGASFLTVHFSHFNLRKGDRVVVRSPSNLERFEYTTKGRNQLGSFFSSAISGDVALVEYYVSTAIRESTEPSFGYTIDKYSHGFPIAAPSESICGRDNSRPAKCYTADRKMYQNSKGVARLLMNGKGACTGWLVGCDGYLLTNEHCINNQNTASNTDYELMSESSKCSEECKSYGGCKGKVVATGAKLIAFDADLDYALLKLDTKGHSLSPYHHLQVRSSGPVLNEEIYIPQHPSAWAKRIAKFVDDGSIARITTLTKSNGCGRNQAGYKADTRGGSSGSPVIALKDHKVVALHHCGGCDNTGVQISKVFKHLGNKFPKCS